MKKILQFTFLIIGFTSFGQKKMTDRSQVYYYPDGQIEEIDSIHYNFNSYSGSFNAWKPTFIFDSPIFDYQVTTTNFLVHSNSTEYFYGTTTPAPLVGTYVNTLVNERIVEENNNNTTRNLYTYTPDGKVLSKTVQAMGGSGLWVTQQSSTYDYDALGNLITTSFYPYSNGAQMPPSYSDTLFYLSGTNKLSKQLNYIDNGGLLVLNSKSESTYLGNNLETIIIYQNISGTLTWVYHIEYSFSGSAPTGFQAYSVNNNVPNHIPEEEVVYEYNSSGQHTNYSYLENGDTTDYTIYTYDNEGFLINSTSFEKFNTVFFKYLTRNYYFENTLSISKIDTEPEVVNVYPNPASESIQIKSIGKLLLVELYNMNGQLLIRQNGTTMNLNAVESGMYILKGKTESGNFTKKIVKN
jgi:hypothetical protein